MRRALFVGDLGGWAPVFPAAPWRVRRRISWRERDRSRWPDPAKFRQLRKANPGRTRCIGPVRPACPDLSFPRCDRPVLLSARISTARSSSTATPRRFRRCWWKSSPPCAGAACAGRSTPAAAAVARGRPAKAFDCRCIPTTPSRWSAKFLARRRTAGAGTISATGTRSARNATANSSRPPRPLLAETHRVRGTRHPRRICAHAARPRSSAPPVTRADLVRARGANEAEMDRDRRVVGCDQGAGAEVFLPAQLDLSESLPRGLRQGHGAGRTGPAHRRGAAKPSSPSATTRTTCRCSPARTRGTSHARAMPSKRSSATVRAAGGYVAGAAYSAGVIEALRFYCEDLGD